MNLPLIAGSLPSGWCPTAGATFWQEVLNKFMAISVAQLSFGTGYTVKVSDTSPTADERDNTLWWKTVGGIPEYLYVYYNGYWSARHPVPANSDFRYMAACASEADVWALDGGDGVDPSVTAPTSHTGAMWEVESEWAGRSPMGVGTISLYDATGNLVTSNLTNGVDAGSFTDEIDITDDMLPEHKHYIGVEHSTNGILNPMGTDKIFGELRADSGAQVSFEDLTGVPTRVGETSLNGETTEDRETLKITHTHPVRGIYIIKRTARVFYVG